MAQSFPDINAVTLLSDSLQPLLDRDTALRTNFSGTTFPVTEVSVGQVCFRTDVAGGTLYVCKQTDPVFDWEPLLSQDTMDSRYIGLNGTVPNGDVKGNIVLDATINTRLFGITTTVGKAVIFYGNPDGSTGIYDQGTGTTLFNYNPQTRQLDFGVGRLTANGGPIWSSGNDGSGSGLDADLLDGRDGSYYLDFRNLANRPSLTDAATTSIAAIGASLGVPNKMNRYGDTVTGFYMFQDGPVGVKRDDNPLLWVWSPALNSAWGMHVTNNNGSSNVSLSWVDGNGTVVDSKLQVDGNGYVWAKGYGWLHDRYAARFTRNGNGSTRVGNCGGNIATSSGVEVFDTGDGSHQIRQFVENCSNCNCNCNYDD